MSPELPRVMDAWSLQRSLRQPGDERSDQLVATDERPAFHWSGSSSANRP
jgi:hypothetical protein